MQILYRTSLAKHLSLHILWILNDNLAGKKDVAVRSQCCVTLGPCYQDRGFAFMTSYRLNLISNFRTTPAPPLPLLWLLRGCTTKELRNLLNS